MYPNLIEALKAKKISYYVAGAAIDMPEPTFRSKVEGTVQCGFSVDDAFKIKYNIFPEYDIEFLFKRENKTTALS